LPRVSCCYPGCLVVSVPTTKDPSLTLHRRYTHTGGISLIIAVYNKPEALRLVLAACSRQSFTDFEVLIADDGSGPEVARVVEEMQSSATFPIRHLWHEDRGWRKNVALNNGIRASGSDYLVFIDGDCLPSRHFLLDHWEERLPGHVLLGRRVETSERWSTALTLEMVRNGTFEGLGWRELLDGLRGKSLRVEDGVRIPSALLRRLLLRNVRGMLGSNFSAWKRDLVAVNGFDELYDGPGCGEDSDIQFRLSLLGIRGKSMRNLAVQYHLWHAQTRVSDPSWDRFEMVKRTGRARCTHGLVRLEET
jgi:glycosyltransferase involved in cell wall biosynthesis